MEYYEINDNELLYLINVDEVFKKILFDKYNMLIKNICFDYYKSFPNIDIEDLIQEAYLGFSYAIENYDANKNTSFKTFAIICVEGRLKSYVRSCSSLKNSILNKALSIYKPIINGIVLKDTIAIENNTLDEVMLLEEVNNITKFKNDLPFFQSQIFELKFNGFSYKEIAKLLDIDVNKISYQIRCIKKKFLNMYEEY